MKELRKVRHKACGKLIRTMSESGLRCHTCNFVGTLKHHFEEVELNDNSGSNDKEN